MSQGLPKKTISVAMNQGIDTKTDPKQVQGKLLVLQNAYFQTLQKIRKRNGYIALPSLGTGVGLCTYNNELVSLDGTNLYSYNANGSAQVSKGALPTVSLAVQTIVRNTNQQTTQDAAQNGTLRCFSWTDSGGGCRYSIFDTSTGQSIVNNQVLASTALYAKVLAVGTKFVLIYYDSSGTQLFYKSIDVSTPSSISSAVPITADANTTTVSWGATVINGAIFLVYNNTLAKLSLFSISSTLVLSSQVNFGSDNANVVTVFGDASFNVWVSYAINGTSGVNTNINVFALNNAMNSTVLAKTNIDAFQINGVGPSINTLTGIVTSVTATVYYEVIQSDVVGGDKINFIKQNTVTTGGVVGSAAVFNRGVGLASKAFSYQGNYYLLVAFQSNLQPTYFLIRGDGIIVGKVSPSEGGGLSVKPILPEVLNLGSGSFLIATLIKDSVTVQNGVIATQTGVQSSVFKFNTAAPSRFVLGNNLHVMGAIPDMYDGGSVVEHGFSVYPEGIYSSWNPASPTYNGGIGIGPSVAAINQKQYCAVYEWTDNQGQNHQSAPSVPINVDIPSVVAPTTITGTITTNGNTITSATGGLMGQYVNLVSATGKVNWAWNATITNVSGTTLTLSANHGLAAASGLTFMITGYPLSLYFTRVPQPVVLGTGFGSVNATFGQIITPVPTFVSNYPAGTYFKDGSFSASAGFNTSNPPNGLGTTSMYYGTDTFTIPVSVPTLKLTSKTKVSIAVYSTLVNGTIFFRASSPTSLIYNDQTVDYVTFTDSTADNILIGNQQLYTTGGEVENIAAPAVNFSFTYKSRSVAVPSESLLSFIYSKQVIPGLPVEYNPLEFIQNIDSKIGSITAGGQMDDKMILFGPTSKFYVVGNGPTASGSNNDFSEATKIAGNTGCTNPASVIEIADGLMYQDPANGIWLLDRSLQEHYIGMDVEAFNSYQVTSVQLIQGVTQVRFSLSNGTDLVFDYVAKQWSVFTNHSANDACIFQNLYSFINSSGAIWQESVGTFTDPGNTPILIGLTSGWIQTSDIQGFMRLYQLLLLGTYYSPHTILVSLYSDFSATPFQQTVAQFPSTGTPQFRVFLEQMKGEAFQIQLQEQQSGSFGQGFDLSNVQLLVGYKKGPYKVPAAVSYG